MLKNEKLEELHFIGGGSQSLNFTVLDRFGDPLDLLGCQVKWTLCNIGEKENPLLIKDNGSVGGIIVESNRFTVTLSPNETKYFYDGIYEQEPIIVQPNGKVLRPCYGHIYIKQGSIYQN